MKLKPIFVPYSCTSILKMQPLAITMIRLVDLIFSYLHYFWDQYVPTFPRYGMRVFHLLGKWAFWPSISTTLVAWDHPYQFLQTLPHFSSYGASQLETSYNGKQGFERFLNTVRKLFVRADHPEDDCKEINRRSRAPVPLIVMKKCFNLFSCCYQGLCFLP